MSIKLSTKRIKPTVMEIFPGPTYFIKPVSNGEKPDISMTVDKIVTVEGDQGEFLNLFPRDVTVCVYQERGNTTDYVIIKDWDNEVTLVK